MNDLIDWLKKNGAKATGIITALAALLTSLGVFGPEGQDTFIGGFDNVWGGILLALMGLSGIFMAFSKPANTKDFGSWFDRFKNSKTTVIGIAMAVITILGFFGVLEPENQAGLSDAVVGTWDGFIMFLSGVQAIVLLLSKD